MADRIGRREAVSAFLALPGLAISSGCEASSKVRTKVFKVVKKITKRLSKYTPGGWFVELVELVLEIKAIVEGTDEVVDKIGLTPEEAESLRNGGELEIEDADGHKHTINLKGK
jgi:hypothetical protein